MCRHDAQLLVVKGECGLIEIFGFVEPSVVVEQDAVEFGIRRKILVDFFDMANRIGMKG